MHKPATGAEAKCRGWLSMARNFINAGMPHKAEPYLRKVIDNYGDTDHAEDAKKLLKQIEPEESVNTPP